MVQAMMLSDCDTIRRLPRFVVSSSVWGLRKLAMNLRIQNSGCFRNTDISSRLATGRLFHASYITQTFRIQIRGAVLKEQPATQELKRELPRTRWTSRKYAAHVQFR